MNHFIKIGLVFTAAAMLVACNSQPPKTAAAKPLSTSAPLTTQVIDKPALTLDVEYKTALTYMQSGRDRQAIEMLTSISERYPLYAGPKANLALIYQSQGLHLEAEQAFMAALELNPQSPAILNRAGMFYREQGNFDKAAQLYNQAISADPEYLHAYRNLGILQDLYLHNPSEALALYRRYQTLHAVDDSQVKLWVAELERKVGVKTRIASKPPVTREDAGPTLASQEAEQAPTQSASR